MQKIRTTTGREIGMFEDCKIPRIPAPRVVTAGTMALRSMNAATRSRGSPSRSDEWTGMC